MADRFLYARLARNRTEPFWKIFVKYIGAGGSDSGVYYDIELSGGIWVRTVHVSDEKASYDVDDIYIDAAQYGADHPTVYSF